MDIKTGDILHCRSNGVLGKAIRTFTNGEFNHTAVALVVDGFLLVVDAQKDGVFPRSYYHWIREYNYDFVVQRSPFLINEQTFRPRALSQCGTPYDKKLLLVEHSVNELRKKYGKDAVVDIEYKGNGKFVCSEYALWCHSVRNAHEYTPQMVKEYCDRNDWKTITTRKQMDQKYNNKHEHKNIYKDL